MSQIEYNQVICGDSEQVLKTFPNQLVDLIITSPPYDKLRDYKGYSFNFESIAKELFRIIKDGGILVWIVGDSVINGSESGTSFKQALFFKDIGFNLHDTMIYQKNGSSLNDDLRYNQNFEYMFIFSKGKPKTFNPIKDRRNNWSGVTKKPRIREKNGEISTRVKYDVNRYGKRWNVWEYSPGYMKSSTDEIAFEHPAIFPEELAKDHILSWSNESDLILDPFAGSGTTLKMARLLNRNYIGIEISSQYCNIIQKRLAKYNNHRLEVFNK